MFQIIFEQLNQVDPCRILTWPQWLVISFACTILLSLEFVSYTSIAIFKSSQLIRVPVNVKQLDEFSTLDNTFIVINKMLVIPFSYHLLYVTWKAPHVLWHPEKVTLSNTLGSMMLMVLLYDFTFFWFHRLLHSRIFYHWIHKHHHRQKAPSRGNLDGINAHPFEFIFSEYFHLLAVALIPCHVLGAIAFILTGAVLGSLNHTRCDVTIPGVFSVKSHDFHHQRPNWNYGQYTYLWDKAFGCYCDHELDALQNKPDRKNS